MANQPSYIEKIDWVSDKQEVHIEQRKDELKLYLWIQYIDNKVPEEPSQKCFIAGDNGKKLLDALSPLVAIHLIVKQRRRYITWFKGTFGDSNDQKQWHRTTL